MDNFLWTEKYRPSTVSDIVLPKRVKKPFLDIVKDKNVPNMILSGSAGVGKTTLALAICKELGLDSIVINGSDQRNIDTLRTKIVQFASTVSLSDGVKVVIIDEGDYLNPQSTQPALRGVIEEFADNCRFIITCNYVNRIIEPLQSRCIVHDISVKRTELPEICVAFMSRLEHILQQEGVEYDKKVLPALISKNAPDWRKVLNVAQTYSKSGSIDLGILESIDEENFKALLNHMRRREFNNVRKWVVNNSDIDSADLFNKLYNSLRNHIEDASYPNVILILAEWQYKASFVVNQEINTMACLTELMSEIIWKN